MLKRFDPKMGQNVTTIFVGEYFVSQDDVVISTVLGSCVAVCLYDEINNIAGMNHFMLPESKINNMKLYSDEKGLNKEKLLEESMRYGISSMEVLIAEMQKSGAERKNLKAKLFGGGKTMASISPQMSIGDKNIGFARAFLKTEGIRIVKENLGGFGGQKIFFLTRGFSVFVKSVSMEAALSEEQKYLEKLQELKKKSTVVLF